MNPITRFFLLILPIVCAAGAQAQSTGSMKVLDTVGDVIITDRTTGAMDILTKGMMLTDNMIIVTGAGAFAEFALSNGTRMMLSAESKLQVSQLSQAPFNSTERYEKLEADPSNSQSFFYLTYGNVITHVKKLQSGSNFSIETPVGKASILGTTASVSVVRTGKTVTMTVRNADGTVEVFAKTATGEFLNLPEGEKVEITLEDINSPVPTITLKSPTSMSIAEQRRLVKAVGSTLREVIVMEESPLAPDEVDNDSVDRSQLIDVEFIADALERGIPIPDNVFDNLELVTPESAE